MHVRLWAVAPVLGVVAGVVLVGCGGGGEPATDEEYVRAVCSSVADLRAEIDELTDQEPDASDLDALRELMEDFAAALDDAADALDDVNPPGDVARSHDDVVKAFRAAATAMEDGEIEALQDFDPGANEFDPAVQERLGAIAGDIKECEGLGLF